MFKVYMHRLNSAVILVMITAVLIFTGCSSSHEAIRDTRPPPINDTQNDTIGNQRLSLALNRDEIPTFQPMIDRFERENPDINVQTIALESVIQSADGSTGTPLTRVAQRADVFSSFIVGSQEQVSPLLLDLSPYRDADATFAAEDFYPSALAQASTEGRMWIMPTSFRIPLLAYSMTAFRESGLTPPTVSWGWKDLLSMAEQIAGDINGPNNRYGLLDPSGGVLTLSAVLQARGSDHLLGRDATFSVDQPEFIEAIKEVRRLVKSKAVFLPGISSTQGDTRQLIDEGRIAIWPTDVSDADQATDSQSTIGTITFPSGENPIAGQSLAGYSVSAGTAHPDAAWRLVNFLSRQSLTNLPSITPGHVPARLSVILTTNALDAFPANRAQIYQQVFSEDSGNTLNYTSIDPSLFELLQRTLVATLPLDKDIDQELTRIQRELEVERTTIAQGATPSTQSPIIVSTPIPLGPKGETALVFLTQPSNVPQLLALQEQFRTQQPDIDITLITTNELTDAPSFATLSQSSDCFLWRDAPTTAEDVNTLFDIQPLIDADATMNLDDYPGIVRNALQGDGKLQGLPYSFQINELFYNEHLFTEAQLSPPTLQWSPTDFLATSLTLTRNKDGQQYYGYAPMLDPGRDLLFFVQQFGGALVTGAGRDARPNFTDPTVVKAIQWYLDLSLRHKVTPLPTFTYRQTTYFGAEGRDLIAQGRVAMWFPFGIQSPETPDITARAPLPVSASGLSATDIRVQSLFISAQTKHANECWSWISFLSRVPSAARDAIPARISDATSDQWKTSASPEMISLYNSYAPALKQDTPRSIALAQNDIDFYWFYQALTNVVQGQEELPAALERAQTQTQNFMECVQTQTAPLACALKVDPSYEGFLLEVTPVPGSG